MSFEKFSVCPENSDHWLVHFRQNANVLYLFYIRNMISVFSANRSRITKVKENTTLTQQIRHFFIKFNDKT